MGAYYFEDVRYYFVGWDVAVVLEELAGLWTDAFEVRFVPLYILVLRFAVRVNLWCGHAREEEELGESGGAIDISNKWENMNNYILLHQPCASENKEQTRFSI